MIDAKRKATPLPDAALQGGERMGRGRRIEWLTSVRAPMAAQAGTAYNMAAVRNAAACDG